MPTSNSRKLTDIVELIEFTDPQSTLDVGVGWGTYGFLTREYVDICDGRNKYRDWKRRIEGVEVFKEYLTPVHGFIYDKIYVGNAIDVLPALKTNYDLILLIDILEHFEYEEGMKLLEECKEHGRNIIIATPRHIGTQGTQKDAFGNPYERHRFAWRKKHFASFKNKFFVYNEVALLCYIGEDAARIAKKLRTREIKSTIKRIAPFLKVPYRFFKRIAQRNN